MCQNQEIVPILAEQEKKDEEKEDGGEEEVEEQMDGGVWAWVVVLASFLCNMVIDGLAYSFGVLMEPLQKEFEAGAGSVSFVGSILAGVILLTGPISAYAVNKLGTRITCIAGSLVSSLAIFASSYSSSLLLLVISYGVAGGFGLGLMYVPAVVSVGQYFTKRLSFATGLCVTGSGFGTFVFAPIAASLVEWAGWRGCNRLMALFCCLGALCGLALVPKTSKSSSSKSTTGEGDRSILRNPALLLVMAGNIPTPMAVYITYTYLPSMAESLGYSTSQASLLISVVGITNTVGRVFSGWVSDLPQFSALAITIVASLLSSIFPVLMPLAPSYTWLAVLAGVFGFVLAAIPTVTSRLLVDILGIDKLNSSFGALTFVRGCAALLGPPIAGAALDRLHSQAVPFTLSSIFLAASSLIHLVLWFLNRRTSRQQQYSPL